MILAMTRILAHVRGGPAVTALYSGCQSIFLRLFMSDWSGKSAALAQSCSLCLS